MDNELYKAKQYAFRLLKVRLRAEKELEKRLVLKNFSQETINQVINYLKVQGFIDDLNFAKALVNSRINYNPRSKRLLKYELIKKGVSKEIAQTAVDEIGREDEQDFAGKIAERKFEKLKKEPQIVAKRRLIDYLRRRGFDSGIILKIIRKLFNNEE